MIWLAPSEKDTAAATLEKRLWDSAAAMDELTRDRSARSRSPDQVEPASAEQIAQGVEPNR